MLNEQIGEKIEGSGLEISSSVNGRSWRHKKFDGIRRATKNKASESSRR